MGLYDREYGRSERTPWDRVENPRNITIILLVINVVVFFVDAIFTRTEADPSGAILKTHVFNDWLTVFGHTLYEPWMWWKFLTYGFAHDPNDIRHLLFNMIGLFVFGRDVERRMGQSEFLRFYLITVIVGGLVGAATQVAVGQPNVGIIGASGAVIATAVMFACYFPNREILLMLVFPVKAWVLAVFFVMADLAGAFGLMSGMGASNTAFTVHLAGAAMALGYHFLHWNFRWLDFGAVGDLPQRARQRSRRMKLKLHDPEKKLRLEADEADRILAKIHQSGESSLTSAERKILERYSRRQRERREP